MLYEKRVRSEKILFGLTKSQILSNRCVTKLWSISSAQNFRFTPGLTIIRVKRPYTITIKYLTLQAKPQCTMSLKEATSFAFITALVVWLLVQDHTDKTKNGGLQLSECACFSLCLLFDTIARQCPPNSSDRRTGRTNM